MDPAALRTTFVVLAHLVLLAVALALIAIDIAEHRLPDRIVLPVLAGEAALVVAEAVATGDGGSALRAGAGMLALGGFYALLRVISGGGLGGGDVKLAAAIGLVLGWHGWQALVVGAVAAFVLGALAALVLLAAGRADGGTRIAFGPWMILGAALGIGLARPG